MSKKSSTNVNVVTDEDGPASGYGHLDDPGTSSTSKKTSSWHFQTVLNVVLVVAVVALLAGIGILAALYESERRKHNDSSNSTHILPPSPGAIKCLKQLRDVNKIPTVEPNSMIWCPWAFVAWPQYNLQSTLPWFVVSPRTSEELRIAIKCAHDNGVHVAVKSGGHDYIGFSQAGVTNPRGGFTISTQNLDALSVDKAWVNAQGQTIPVVHVGAGNRFEPIYTLMNKSGLVFAGGLCPTVGVSGFLLGGGLGPLSREHGIGCDNVQEVEMVLSNGSGIVTANSRQNSDLLWALCGGGGPSFGIATRWTVQVFPAYPLYSYMEFCVGTNQLTMTQSLTALDQITNGVDFPKWITIHWRLLKRGGAPQGVCYLVYSLRGLNDTLADPQFKLLLAATPNSIQWNFQYEYSNLLDMDIENAVVKGYERVATWPEIYAHWMYPMSADAIVKLLQLYVFMPNFTSSGAGCNMQGMCFGGNIALKPTNATAFPWREPMIYVAGSGCSFTTQSEEVAAKNFSKSYFAAFGNGIGKGGYLNFPQDAFQGLMEYAPYYWSTNVPRLSETRQKWNPATEYPLKFPQEVPLP